MYYKILALTQDDSGLPDYANTYDNTYGFPVVREIHAISPSPFIEEASKKSSMSQQRSICFQYCPPFRSANNGGEKPEAEIPAPMKYRSMPQSVQPPPQLQKPMQLNQPMQLSPPLELQQYNAKVQPPPPPCASSQPESNSVKEIAGPEYQQQQFKRVTQPDTSFQVLFKSPVPSRPPVPIQNRNLFSPIPMLMSPKLKQNEPVKQPPQTYQRFGVSLKPSIDYQENVVGEQVPAVNVIERQVPMVDLSAKLYGYPPSIKPETETSVATIPVATTLRPPSVQVQARLPFQYQFPIRPVDYDYDSFRLRMRKQFSPEAKAAQNKFLSLPGLHPQPSNQYQRSINAASEPDLLLTEETTTSVSPIFSGEDPQHTNNNNSNTNSSEAGIAASLQPTEEIEALVFQIPAASSKPEEETKNLDESLSDRLPPYLRNEHSYSMLDELLQEYVLPRQAGAFRSLY